MKKASTRTGKTNIVRDQRGAVLAEFVVAIFPLLTIFFVFLQFSAVTIASLLNKHAAVVAARCAAVVANEHHNVPEGKDDNGAGEITMSAQAAVGFWSKYMTTTAVVTEDKSSEEKPNGPYDLVTVEVTSVYKCGVPLGKTMCPGGFVILKDKKSMAHQGARYKLD